MERSGMSEKCFFVMIYVEIILLSRWAQNNAIYTTIVIVLLLVTVVPVTVEVAE